MRAHTGRMITLLSILALMAGLAAFGVLAVRYGADTRDGFDERREVRDR